MALVDRLREVSDRLSALPQRLGVPQYAQVVLELNTVYTILEPQPQIFEVDPRRVGLYLSGSVEISPDDLILKGISRSYPEELLTNATYILNATQDQNGKWQGKRCECYHLDRSKLITYDVLVKAYRNI